MSALWDASMGHLETGEHRAAMPLTTDGPMLRWWQEQHDTAEADRVSYHGLRLAQGETASLHLDATMTSTFVAQELRDRVVIMLLFDQVVREEHVDLAWQLWQQMSRDGIKEPLWRVLLLFPELDRDLIYAEAARVYGFEDARISRPQALMMMHQVEKTVSREVWDQMVALRVVPITEAEERHKHRLRTVFATQDPTRPEVHRLMPTISPRGFELRYAPEDEIVNLLIEAFPQRYNHLKGLSGVAKDFLAGLDYAEPPVVPAVAAEGAVPGLTVAFVLDLFETVLVQAVRQRATDICLLPTPYLETEVYFQIDGDLQRHQVIETPDPNTMLSVIKREIIRVEADNKGLIRKRRIERQVDGVPVRYRVSAVPASEEVHTECIVVRVYG